MKSCFACLLAILVLAATRARAEEIVELPAVEVPPPAPSPTVVGAGRTVTPLRREATTFDVPSAVTVQEGALLRRRKMIRSAPEALLHLPSVMIQKSGPLQSSPYIRGFTGYRNLMLLDGIRFNNASFRSGPNQYWSTIDSYTMERLELARGPLSVLYGSDAVGGTVNVIPPRRESFRPGWHMAGLVSTRVSSADGGQMGRLQVEGNYGRIGFLGGMSFKRYTDIISGDGRLPYTGGATEWNGDLRFDVQLDRRWRYVLAYQHVGQEDAPRTHKTIYAVPFEGTSVGSELRRDYDQDRDLVYTRFVYEDKDDPCALIPEAMIGVSWHRHFEERDRLRSRDRQDLSGFELGQFGVQAQITTRTGIGDVTWGADYYHDEADTWRRDTVGGALPSTAIQGPFGDDSRYDLFGAYVEDTVDLGRFELSVGARFTYASAEADRVEDPASPGSVIRIANDWTNVVGSVRGVYHVNERWNVYGSVAQAFRAPTLYDLTSFEATSVAELPSPDLEPEKYVTFEAGVKTDQANTSGYAAVWYTILDGTIVRSPTGEVLEDTPVVRKDNIGDGWVWGVELEVAHRFRRSWTVFGNASWMNGRAYEYDEDAGEKVFSHLSRLKPLSIFSGVRYEPPGRRGWAQFEMAYNDREERLSLRDQADRSRIPPDGTPSWVLLNLRAGYRVTERCYLGLSLENLLDQNFRIHGSGQNEPGLNAVFTLDVEM